MQPGTQIRRNTLPPELWIIIIRGLPSHYQRSCLSVSKLFHDISLPFVFASINIRLGLLRDKCLADTYEWIWIHLNEREQQEAEPAIRRSCELLQHISRSPTSRLAQVVKRVSVRAYSYNGESPPQQLLDALEEALSVLQLRAFAWYGCHPMPRRHVFEALSTASGESMEDILLPAEFSDHIPVLAFGHLKSLSFLNRYTDNYQRLDYEDPQLDAMRKIVTVKAPSLCSLGIFGEVLWKCNVQRLSALVDLTLVVLTQRAEAIGEILAYCSRLQSLTLLVGAVPYSDLAAIFRSHADALPFLTAFSMSSMIINDETSEAVVEFLKNKPRLERLELGQQWDGRNISIEPAKSFLELLPRLSRLRVLGLELSINSAVSFTSADLLLLGRCIAHRLTALSLWVDVRHPPPPITDMDWIQFLSQLRSCRFLYISTDPYYSSAVPGMEELRHTLFKHPPPHAELVGFNDDVRWMERRQLETGLVAYSESWPLSKVYHRTAGEFGCEEWEWLMRHMDPRLL